jgi:signal peptidase I
MRTYDETKSYQRELSLESSDLLEVARYELVQNRSIQLRITGSTMRPMLDDGDVVMIAPIDPATINSQDIILITTPSGTALIHRVVAIQNMEGSIYALTRGDGSSYQDTPVPLNKVLGRVTALRRKGKGKVIPVYHSSGWFSRFRFWIRTKLATLF